MDGEHRRQRIIELLRRQNAPVTGNDIARELHVSRQVIVQDIALLRADHKEILSTNKGYVLHHHQESRELYKRVYCVNHATEDTLKELFAIVDCGGRVLDVSIEHELYGQITVDLIINNRMDAIEFVEHMQRTEDQPLKALTGGCHYHTVVVDSARNLDRVEEVLGERGFLFQKGGKTQEE